MIWIYGLRSRMLNKWNHAIQRKAQNFQKEYQGKRRLMNNPIQALDSRLRITVIKPLGLLHVPTQTALLWTGIAFLESKTARWQIGTWKYASLRSREITQSPFLIALLVDLNVSILKCGTFTWTFRILKFKIGRRPPSFFGAKKNVL